MKGFLCTVSFKRRLPKLERREITAMRNARKGDKSQDLKSQEQMTLKIQHGNGAAIVVSGFFFTKTAERDSDPYTAKGWQVA